MTSIGRKAGVSQWTNVSRGLPVRVFFGVPLGADIRLKL
jgi:hypothetical protein